MLNVIICANFGVEKLRGLGNTRSKILEFSIEMAGHLYNRAGATAQPVIYFVGYYRIFAFLSLLIMRLGSLLFNYLFHCHSIAWDRL